MASCLIKSIRGSDPQAALYWMARMLMGGEDFRFIARRLVISAAEDIGMADPQALVVANAAAQASNGWGCRRPRLSLSPGCSVFSYCAYEQLCLYGDRQGL